MSRLDETRPFIALAIAVMTVSDTRKEDQDRSGQALKDRIEAAGHTVAGYAIVPDEMARISAQVRDWADDEGIDIVITTGGMQGLDLASKLFVDPGDLARLQSAASMLPSSHRPRVWRTVDELPLTEAGKIDRIALRDNASAGAVLCPGR